MLHCLSLMLRHCDGNVTTIAAIRSCCDDLWQSFNKIVVLFDLVSGCLGNPRRATFVACAVVYGSWLTLDPGGQLLLLLPVRHPLTADAAGSGSGFVVSMAAVWDSSHTPRDCWGSCSLRVAHVPSTTSSAESFDWGQALIGEAVVSDVDFSSTHPSLILFTGSVPAWPSTFLAWCLRSWGPLVAAA